jgi:putative peptidoglycan lipid II flippase
VRLISALQGNHLLLWGTIISAMLNVGLDLLFLPRLGARGIALSTTCVAAVACAFLSFWALRLLRSRERRAL